MSEFVQHALDERGLAYIKQQLRDGWDFCQALLQIVEACAGEITALVPAETPVEALYDFRAGGLLKSNSDPARCIPATSGTGYLMPLSTLVNERARILEEEMHKSPGSLCIVDDVSALWTDRTAEHPTAFWSNRNVYYALHSEAQTIEIKDALNRGDCCYHGVAAVCVGRLALRNTREVSQMNLAELARGATFVSCLAYDGESFVNWRRL